MKIGLIGYGNIAKKHMAAIALTPDCKVSAVYDIQPVDTGSTDIKSFTDLDAMLREDLDLVVICTPNGLHAGHTLAAIQAGHHVICEKPFALNSEDCDKMISAAQKNDKKIFCTMQNRFSPVSQWLKKLTIEDALGEIYLINVSCYWNRNKNYYKQSEWRGKKDNDGGTLFTQFSHYVDTLYWLYGDIKVHNALFQNFDHGDMIEFEDTGLFNFSLQNGAMGTFSYTTSCFEKNFESTLTLIGSKGTIKVAGQYMDRIEYCNIEDIEQPQLDANDNISNIAQIYKNAIAQINGNPAVMTTAEDGLKVVKIIEDVYAFKNPKS